MCLAIPGRVIDNPVDGVAVLDFMGVLRDVHVSLIPGVKTGDYLLVHAGCAISRLEENEAHESLALWEELIRYAASS